MNTILVKEFAILGIFDYYPDPNTDEEFIKCAYRAFFYQQEPYDTDMWWLME